jgi:hypothetical protein
MSLLPRTTLHSDSEQGGLSKPRCTQPECSRKHAVGAHGLLGEGDACVNLATGDNYKSEEEEEWWVNTVRAGEEEMEDSESEESRGREVRYHTSTCMRKDDSGLEDELEYFWEAPIPSDSDEREEDRWWSPGPQEASSEEDEEEVRYLTKLLGLKAKEDDVKDRKSPSPGEDTPGPRRSDHQATLEEPAEEGRESAEASESTEAPLPKRLRRRRLRKKVIRDESHKWEVARHDAWLRELLTDSSGSESEDKYLRFAESGRWIAEMTGSKDKECRKQEGSAEARTSAQAMTTSRGECSGP